MDPAVRKLLDQPWQHLKTYEEIGRSLPADDAELDRWFTELVEAADAPGFMALGVAAIAAKRAVDGRHLVRGAQLLGSNVSLLVNFAWHMTGDVPEHLLAAVSDGQLLPAHSSFALFAAAAICKERRGGVYPPDFFTRARIVSRQHNVIAEMARGPLYGIAAITRDPALAAILEIKSDRQWKLAADVAAKLEEALFGSPYDLVAMESHRQIGQGVTVRRAVARIGRNEPCPCQSGRKYKNCCMARDMERLLDSSHVAGKSQAELRAEPEPYLTLEAIRRIQAHELVRFDPRKIAPELLDEFFIALVAYSLFDRMIECVELLGFPEALDETCASSCFLALHTGRVDPIKKLLALHPRGKEIEANLTFAEKLAILDEESTRFTAVIEDGAIEALRTDDAEHLCQFGLAFLFSKLPATGIFVARGMIPFLNEKRAQTVVKEIGVARDKLGLAAEDPAEDLFEKRLLEATRASEAEDTKESRALAAARERLDAKAREVDFLRRSLESVRQDVKKAEARSKPEPTVTSKPSVAATADEKALQELRFKVQKLKGELTERHEERVKLRHELSEAHSKLESQARPKIEEPVASDPEDEDVVPGQFAELQPIRLPEYPRKFDETLRALPRHVARNALAMIGRLAGGELAAFTGVVRLKACDQVYRQRIGIDHRLLFRLTSDRLEVVDLINRRDLDRRIKSLVIAR